MPLNLVSDRRETARIFIACRPDLFRKDFNEWLRNNFEIWEAFEREANRVWDLGVRHYSARRIGEYIRHNTLFRERANAGDPVFKLNDHFVPDLGRLYVCFYPEREGFFERRPGHSAVRAA